MEWFMSGSRGSSKKDSKSLGKGSIAATSIPVATPKPPAAAAAAKVAPKSVTPSTTPMPTAAATASSSAVADTKVNYNLRPRSTSPNNAYVEKMNPDVEELLSRASDPMCSDKDKALFRKVALQLIAQNREDSPAVAAIPISKETEAKLYTDTSGNLKLTKSGKGHQQAVADLNPRDSKKQNRHVTPISYNSRAIADSLEQGSNPNEVAAQVLRFLEMFLENQKSTHDIQALYDQYKGPMRMDRVAALTRLALESLNNEPDLAMVDHPHVYSLESEGSKIKETLKVLAKAEYQLSESNLPDDKRVNPEISVRLRHNDVAAEERTRLKKEIRSQLNVDELNVIHKVIFDSFDYRKISVPIKKPASGIEQSRYTGEDIRRLYKFAARHMTRLFNMCQSLRESHGDEVINTFIQKIKNEHGLDPKQLATLKNHIENVIRTTFGESNPINAEISHFEHLSAELVEQVQAGNEYLDAKENNTTLSKHGSAAAAAASAPTPTTATAAAPFSREIHLSTIMESHDKRSDEFADKFIMLKPLLMVAYECSLAHKLIYNAFLDAKAFILSAPKQVEAAKKYYDSVSRDAKSEPDLIKKRSADLVELAALNSSFNTDKGKLDYIVKHLKSAIGDASEMLNIGLSKEEKQSPGMSLLSVEANKKMVTDLTKALSGSTLGAIENNLIKLRNSALVDLDECLSKVRLNSNAFEKMNSDFEEANGFDSDIDDDNAQVVDDTHDLYDDLDDEDYDKLAGDADYQPNVTQKRAATRLMPDSSPVISLSASAAASSASVLDLKMSHADVNSLDVQAPLKRAKSDGSTNDSYQPHVVPKRKASDSPPTADTAAAAAISAVTADSVPYKGEPAAKKMRTDNSVGAAASARVSISRVGNEQKRADSICQKASPQLFHAQGSGNQGLLAAAMHAFSADAAATALAEYLAAHPDVHAKLLNKISTPAAPAPSAAVPHKL
jgi:hypothetical protein